ncbi:ORF MSV035 hypothetical protein [Melanoplus sanguinipes entomopoxvirus]|uniref:Uncharacterized protein n=1 Tax=Melanoplus sanguinipes entomopoxvirus TaxID=83191 RepID=Q9YW57_MSEPV|nr:ORF MSV035 hypothetical protein [Melanoplus sanguinipes entomopoxvirus]AAC97838.1 ORF MSV035 hypothetical protein [Melanoplus sanguinipes entomopoxvirus 'O']
MKFKYILHFLDICEVFLDKCNNYRDILSIYKVFKSKRINDNIIYYILKNKKYFENNDLIELLNNLTLSYSNINNLLYKYKNHEKIILFIITRFLIPNSIINLHSDVICYILSCYNIKSTIYKNIYKKYKNTLLCNKLTNSVIQHNININKILPFVKLNDEQINLILNNNIYKHVLIKMLLYNDISSDIINKNKYNILNALLLINKVYFSHHKIKKILLNIISNDIEYTKILIFNFNLNEYYISNILNIHNDKNILSLMLQTQNISNHIIDKYYDEIIELINCNNVSSISIYFYFNSIKNHPIYKNIINEYINNNDINRLLYIINIIQLPINTIYVIFEKYKNEYNIILNLLLYQNIIPKMFNKYYKYIYEIFLKNIDNECIINILYNKYKNYKIFNNILKYILENINTYVKLYTLIMNVNLKQKHYEYILKIYKNENLY